MKIKVEWRHETEGVSEIEVPEAEVLAWLNDPLTGGREAGTWTLDKIGPKECFDWLESGDESVWVEQIDLVRDQRQWPHGDDFELERLHRERT